MNIERIGDPVPFIFLNGASSAGKTSLGKALQEILDEPYLLLGLDTCLHAVPDRWGSGGRDKHLGRALQNSVVETWHPCIERKMRQRQPRQASDAGAIITRAREYMG